MYFFCEKLLKSSIFEQQNRNLHPKKENFNSQLFHYCQNNVRYWGCTSQALKCTARTHTASYYQNGFRTHIATCYCTSHLSKLQPHIASHGLITTKGSFHYHGWMPYLRFKSGMDSNKAVGKAERMFHECTYDIL